MKAVKSNHFGKIWDRIIYPSIISAYESLDEDFLHLSNAQIKPLNVLKDKIEKEYRLLRHSLKKKCYGSGEGSLDNRKIGAIFSRALIKEKPIIFDITNAYQKASQMKSQISIGEYNAWVVDNVLINYKIAYIVGVHLVYLGLMEQWSTDADKKEHLLKLNEYGALVQYPTSPEFDTFGQNIVISLARADSEGLELDTLLFGLQLYQLENYTRVMMEIAVFLEKLEKNPEAVMELVKKEREILFEK